MRTKPIVSSDTVSEKFFEKGYLDAIPILSQDEAQGIWEEVSNSLELDGPKRFKTHLLLPVLDDVVKNPGIIHVVCSVLGTEDVPFGPQIGVSRMPTHRDSTVGIKIRPTLVWRCLRKQSQYG